MPGCYLVPDGLGELLLDDVWYSARPIVLPMAFVTATAAINLGDDRPARDRGGGTLVPSPRGGGPAILAVAAMACATGGVLAAVVAQAVIGAVATCIWWGTFVTAHRRLQLAEDEPADATAVRPARPPASPSGCACPARSRRADRIPADNQVGGGYTHSTKCSFCTSNGSRNGTYSAMMSPVR